MTSPATIIMMRGLVLNQCWIKDSDSLARHGSLFIYVTETNNQLNEGKKQTRCSARSPSTVHSQMYSVRWEDYVWLFFFLCVCVCVCLFSYTTTWTAWEDLSLFLEGGYYYWRCLSWVKIVPTQLCCILLLLIAFIYRYSPLSSRLTALACDSTWVNSFYSAFLNIHWSGVFTALAWLVPQESAARESQSQRVLCTPYNHAPCHFMQSHIRKVYACLAVTCHLRFWQNDLGLLRATAVTRGWNRYRNKSQHRKLTLEKKILPPLQQGFKPETLQSRVRRSNHWAIPAPQCITMF